MKVRFTREAEADLEGIGDKIAERNPVPATTYVRELKERCLSVGDFPHAWPPTTMGRKCTDHRARQLRDRSSRAR
jgi:plasmid stabilization system protein ParE